MALQPKFWRSTVYKTMLRCLHTNKRLDSYIGKTCKTVKMKITQNTLAQVGAYYTTIRPILHCPNRKPHAGFLRARAATVFSAF